MPRTVLSCRLAYDIGPWESDMDAGWFVEMFVEIAKVFSHDRHPRLRKGKPSVPPVPPRSTSEEAM
ncbi:hypothetical protein RAD15_04610 [Bradyrhizobium sp. 14AA]